MYLLKKFFIALPDLAQIFCGGSNFKRALLLLQLWYFALTRKTILRGKSMKFILKFLDKSFVIYIESMVDIAVLQEVFLLEEYDWELTTSPKTIIDLGAHFGDTALYYHLKYPEARIYAVEPAPETFKRLLKNVGSISNITPIQAGISNRDGFAELNIGESSIGNSFQNRSDDGGVVSVPVYTLRTLLNMQGIARADLVKFDIEGAEEMMFSSADPAELATAYIGEIHEDLISIDKETFISYFNEFNVNKENLENTQRFIIKAEKRINNQVLSAHSEHAE